MRSAVRTAAAICLLLFPRAALQAAESNAEEKMAAASGAIVVRVVDEAGNPQADATVNVFTRDWDRQRWRDLGRELRTDTSGVAAWEGLVTDEYYLVHAKVGELIGFRGCSVVGENTRYEADLKLELPVATRSRIHIRDEAGQPVAGAKLWSLHHDGTNGSLYWNSSQFESCGFGVEPSNRDGELTLPPLPPGRAKVRVNHPDYVTCETEEFAVGGARVDVTLCHGVKIRLRLETDANNLLPDWVITDIRPNDAPDLHGRGRWSVDSDDGIAELTVCPGTYQRVWLTHPDYAITPIYSLRFGAALSDPWEPFEIAPGRDVFTLRVRPKVKVRGRAIDRDTGKPVVGAYVRGELHTGPVDGPFARFTDEWTYVDLVETNEKGEYEIGLAAGRARISFREGGQVAAPPCYEVEVAADGSNTVPDFLVGPLPKVRGVVQDEHGQPVPKTVVRFRGSRLTFMVEPTIADERGRFELAPRWIPEDLRTHERLPVHTVVAFHPYETLYAVAEVDFDRPESLNNLVLRLRPEDFPSLVERFDADLTAWDRGILTENEKEEVAVESRVGKPAPELDGAHWLNTEKPAMSLAHFHGKYVLLQFWTTWCGPCHEELPSLKLLDELYRDRGLVVVGVHDNSMPLSSIEADVAKNELRYPIVVDHADGRILAAYKVSGYPTYLLIDPDGNFVKDQHTPGPSLRNFKIEIIRQLIESER